MNKESNECRIADLMIHNLLNCCKISKMLGETLMVVSKCVIEIQMKVTKTKSH